jgi:hypothetical protein
LFYSLSKVRRKELVVFFFFSLLRCGDAFCFLKLLLCFDSNTIDRAINAYFGEPSGRTLDIGDYKTCVVLNDDGAVKCWGNNFYCFLHDWMLFFFLKK